MAWYQKGSLLDKLITSIDKWAGNNPKETVDYNKMTKAELEEYGRTIGIELDRRKTKANMIKDLNDFTGD